MILRAVQAGAGPTLVLLHGLFGNSGNFRQPQAALAARFRVIALDLRNHGGSPHAEAMDYAAQAGDVTESLAALGVADCALIGHSMGGKVAMRLALDRPALVSRLIVVDIAPVKYPPHFSEYVAAMRAVPPSATRAQADALLAAAVPDERLRAFLMQNFRGGADPPWRIGLDEIAAELPAIGDWDDSGASYAGPALFLAGERSDYIQAADRPRVMAAFPNARFATVNGAGHWVHAENLTGFLTAVAGFLA